MGFPSCNLSITCTKFQKRIFSVHKNVCNIEQYLSPVRKSCRTKGRDITIININVLK